jgi:protein SCO1/2
MLLAILALAAAADAADLPRRGPAPNFALTTPQNDRLWLTHLRGRAVALAFTCTTCGGCPQLLPTLAATSRALGDAAGRHVFFVAVTTDPARDTPSVLREFGRRQGLRPPAWLFLTGRSAEVDVVLGRYGVEVRQVEGRREAPCLAVLVDAAGAVRARYDAATLEGLPADLRALLAEPPG